MQKFEEIVGVLLDLQTEAASLGHDFALAELIPAASAAIGHSAFAATAGWYAVYHDDDGVRHYPVAFWKTRQDGVTVGYSTRERYLCQPDSDNLDDGWKGYAYYPNGAPEAVKA